MVKLASRASARAATVASLKIENRKIVRGGEVGAPAAGGFPNPPFELEDDFTRFSSETADCLALLVLGLGGFGYGF